MTRTFLPELDNWAEGVGRITDDRGVGAWNEETEFNPGVEVVDTESPGSQ